MEKLTSGEFMTLAHAAYAEFEKGNPGSHRVFWERIQAELEAAREETRAELLKDHFKLGEEVVSLNGDVLFICAKSKATTGLAFSPHGLRRPPKKRPMNISELLDSARKHDEPDFDVNLFRENLRSLLAASGIPTETEAP